MRMVRIFSLVFLLGGAVTGGWATDYVIHDLANLLPGYLATRAWGVNNQGEVVGQGTTGGFAWNSVKGMRIISGGSAYGVNNNGVAVVTGSNGSFLWDTVNDQRTTTINSLVDRINDLGQVSGASGYSAAIWDPTEGVTTINPFPGTSYLTKARALNNLGQIVGRSDLQWPSVYSFFWDSNTGIHSIDPLPDYPTAYAWGVNDLGQVVGDCRDSSERVNRAFLWNSVLGTRDLGFYGTARDINNAGQVVGDFDSAMGAFIYDDAHGAQYLPSLTPGGPATAFAISENGLIVGEALASDRTWHAVLWTPVVPEPSTLLALSVGLGVLSLVRRDKIRRNR